MPVDKIGSSDLFDFLPAVFGEQPGDVSGSYSEMPQRVVAPEPAIEITGLVEPGSPEEIPPDTGERQLAPAAGFRQERHRSPEALLGQILRHLSRVPHARQAARLCIRRTQPIPNSGKAG